jgi:hypothetical protein
MCGGAPRDSAASMQKAAFASQQTMRQIKDAGRQES